MRRLCLALSVSLTALAPTTTAEPARPLEEIWEVALLDGARIGHAHTRTVEAGPGRLRTTTELALTLRRHGSLLRLRMEHGTDEAPEGKVLGVFMRQHHPGGRQLVLEGTVDGDRLHVKVDAGRIERRLRWSDEVVGLRGLEHLFEKRKPRPGDSFRLLRYEPTFNTVVTVRVAVKEREAVDLLGARKSLLRVELVPDVIEVPGHRVVPPKAVWWLDDHFVPVRRQVEMEGLGKVVLARATRAAALAPVTAVPRAADVGLNGLVPVNRAIARPHATRSAVYKITLREGGAAAAFVSDAHQEVRRTGPNSVELTVHPVRLGPADVEAGKAPAECLASCHYIDSADERVRELARRAVGAEKEDWKKAVRVERWVKVALRVDNAAPLAPASTVARSLRGDCRHAALLTAALCRAAGVPARTAIGLVYVERNRRPYLGFHMWAEVWVGGRWVGLDGTLGLGGVGATHVKVTDHSWHDTPSLTPLLPVARVLGKLRVEVVRVD